MRFLERHPSALVDDLRQYTERQTNLACWLYDELTSAESDRFYLESVWQNNDRIYHAMPQNATRDIPYINASNHESTLAAEKTDDIYSQILSAVTALNPFITARATNARFVPHAKAIQKRLDLGVNSAMWNVMPAFKEGLKDLLKRGTCLWAIHWTEAHKKTRLSRMTAFGSRIKAVPIEYVLVQSGSCHDIQELPWIAIFNEYTASQLEEKATRLDWDISTVKTPRSQNEVRRTRERLTHQRETSSPAQEKYGVYTVHCWYDLDEDDEEEELLVYFNLESRAILDVQYGPYDRFPYAHAVFDLNEYLFYGKSVIEILTSLNTIASNVLNHWIDNGFLANTRMFKSKPNTLGESTVTVWAGRNLETTDPLSLDTIQLADIYPSWQNLWLLIDQLSQRRVGIPSTQQTTQALGNRTPGITALTIMQNLSQRHAAAFDSVRNGLAQAIRQCLYREQEQLLLGNLDLEIYLSELLGQEDAILYMQALTNERFDDAIAIELTASSASINKEADKQNAILVGNYALQFAPVLLQLVAAAGSPQSPEPLRNATIKVITSLTEIFDNIVRAFEHIRNPEIVATDVSQEAQQISQMASMAQMMQALMAQSMGGVPGGPLAQNALAEPQGVPAQGAF